MKITKNMNTFPVITAECERGFSKMNLICTDLMSTSHHIKIQVNKANGLLGLKRRSYEHLSAEFVALLRPHLEFGNAM